MNIILFIMFNYMNIIVFIMLKYMDKIHLILISCVVILLYDTQVLIYKLFITPKIGVENWVLLIFD